LERLGARGPSREPPQGAALGKGRKADRVVKEDGSSQNLEGASGPPIGGENSEKYFRAGWFAWSGFELKLKVRKRTENEKFKRGKWRKV